MRYVFLLLAILLAAGLGVPRSGSGRDSQCSVVIETPQPGERVGGSGDVTGVTMLPRGGYLWVLSHRRGLAGWWPQGGGAAVVENGRWSVFVTYGIPGELGTYEVAAVVVDGGTDAILRAWVQEARPPYLPTTFPNTMEECPVRKVVVQKVSG